MGVVRLDAVGLGLGKGLGLGFSDSEGSCLKEHAGVVHIDGESRHGPAPQGQGSLGTVKGSQIHQPLLRPFEGAGLRRARVWKVHDLPNHAHGFLEAMVL